MRGVPRRGLLGSARLGTPALLALTLPLPPILPPPGPPAPGPPPPSAEGQHQHGRLGVRVATTGEHSELVRALPIARRPGRAQRVALSLRLPKVRAGDRVRVTAEVQVSTTCPPARRITCIGRPYAFNPKLTGRLILADRRRAGGGRTISTHRVTCFQQAPNRNHHCVLTFAPNAFRLTAGERRACAQRCYLDLLLGASNPRARPHQVVVLGADRPNHEVVQDGARLAAMVLPQRTARSGVIRTARGPASRQLPVRRAGHRKRVLYSVVVPHPVRGERILALARTRLAIRRLPYNVYLRSQLILARSPTSTGPGRLAIRSSILGGTLTPANGFDCTRGRSGFRSPCPVRKAGITVIRRTPRKASGAAAPLYVNLVTGAKALIRKPRPGDAVRVRRGVLRVVTYRPH